MLKWLKFSSFFEHLLSDNVLYSFGEYLLGTYHVSIFIGD